MRTRKTAAIAGAAAVTAFAATVGLGANFGLFGLAQTEGRVGRLDGARVISVVEDRPVATSTTGGSTGAMPDD